MSCTALTLSACPAATSMKFRTPPGFRHSNALYLQDWEEGDGDYVAPELLKDTGKPSPAADVYSLGATLFECATGACYCSSVHGSHHCCTGFSPAAFCIRGSWMHGGTLANKLDCQANNRDMVVKCLLAHEALCCMGTPAGRQAGLSKSVVLQARGCPIQTPYGSMAMCCCQGDQLRCSGCCSPCCTQTLQPGQVLRNWWIM